MSTDHTEASARKRPGRPAHGQVCYLQIPARDVARSAAFYRAVFGWQVELGGAGFEAPGLIGQWVAERPPAPGAAGILAWIWVEDLAAVLERVRANGGETADPPAPDGPRLLATIRDPAGNVVGLAASAPR